MLVLFWSALLCLQKKDGHIVTRAIYHLDYILKYTAYILFSCWAGARIAQHAGKHLHKSIVNRPEYSTGQIEAAIKQVLILPFIVIIL